MWDCPGCGCRCIAASLTNCPMCWKERDVPKATVSSGASNAWADDEAAAAAPETAPPAVEVPEAAGPVQAVSGSPKPAPRPAPAAKPADPGGM